MKRLLPLLFACAGACDASGTFPLTLEVKDGLTTPGRKPDEVELVVKAVPGAEIKYEGQTRNLGDRATDSFIIQKSDLKLGKNTFNVEGTAGVLFSKKTAKATATWDAPAKGFLRFYPGSGGDGGGTLSCGGSMCGATTFPVSKAGKVGLELESAVNGFVSFMGRRDNAAPHQRLRYEVDLTQLLGAQPAQQRDTLSLPITLEAGSEKATEKFFLQGNIISDLLLAQLARADKGPVTFPGEGPAPAAPRGIAVVGLPSTKLLVVGKPEKVEDLDLVATATTAERFFACGGAGKSASGILYLDQQLEVFDRRAGKSIESKKLMADRVACPPTPTAGQVKANVRDVDVTRALEDLLKPKK